MDCNQLSGLGKTSSLASWVKTTEKYVTFKLWEMKGKGPSFVMVNVTLGNAID